MHREITQCKLHAGMRPYVHNKHFNWLALNMIQRYNTRAKVLKRTKDVIVSGNIILRAISTPCKDSIVTKFKYCALA